MVENAEKERESEEKESEIVVSVFCLSLKFLYSDFVCFLLSFSSSMFRNNN